MLLLLFTMNIIDVDGGERGLDLGYEEDRFWGIFFNCWFIVDSTQYMRYLDMPSLMVGTFDKPPSIHRDLAP